MEYMVHKYSILYILGPVKNDLQNGYACHARGLGLFTARELIEYWTTTSEESRSDAFLSYFWGSSKIGFMQAKESKKMDSLCWRGG